MKLCINCYYCKVHCQCNYPQWCKKVNYCCEKCEAADSRIAELEAQLTAAQAEIARLRSGGNIHNCEAAEEQISALEKDAAMLDWIADNQIIEIIADWNIHEIANWIAYERDVDSAPTVEDYRQALRRMICAAMDAEAAHSGEGEKR